MQLKVQYYPLICCRSSIYKLKITSKLYYEILSVLFLRFYQDYLFSPCLESLELTSLFKSSGQSEALSDAWCMNRSRQEWSEEEEERG